MSSPVGNTILSAIPYIRFSGLANEERWLIIETAARVYFIQIDSFISIFPRHLNPFRAIAFSIMRKSDEVFMEQQTDWSAKNLDAILSRSMQYVSLLKSHIREVEVKNRFLGGATLLVPTDRENNHKLTLKLKKRELNSFLQITQRSLETSSIDRDAAIIYHHNKKRSWGSAFFDIIFEIGLLVLVVGFCVILFLRPEWLGLEP